MREKIDNRWENRHLASERLIEKSQRLELFYGKGKECSQVVTVG